MRKRICLQLSLLFAAALATALIFCIPALLAASLYRAAFCLFVLLPHGVVIVLQLRAVNRRYSAYREAADALRHRAEPGGKEAKPQLLLAVIDALHTIARIKSDGINPERAGPIPAFV